MAFPTTGLVSYWKADESSGNMADSAGSNTLTNNNTATFTTGKINNAAVIAVSGAKFFSITDAAQTGLDPTGDFSIQAWVYPTTLTNGQTYSMFIKDYAGGGGTARGYWLRTDGTSKTPDALIFNANAAGNTGVTCTTAMSVNNWYHLVVTYDYISDGGSKLTIYLNGTQEAQSTTAVGPVQNTAATLGLGGRPQDASEYFEGRIDEIGFWNVELTSSQVTDLYNSGNGLAYTTAPTQASGDSMRAGFGF